MTVAVSFAVRIWDNDDIDSVIEIYDTPLTSDNKNENKNENDN